MFGINPYRILNRFERWRAIGSNLPFQSIAARYVNGDGRRKGSSWEERSECNVLGCSLR
jgi:hypothetical protein